MKYLNPKDTQETIAGFAEVIRRLKEFMQRQDLRSGNYETKSDGSPVGDLDVAIEKTLGKFRIMESWKVLLEILTGMISWWFSLD